MMPEKYISATEALDSLKKRDAKNLTYEQKICLDFLKKYIKIPAEDARKIMKELEKIGRIDSRQASIIVNILPKKKEEVKLIFSKEITTLSDDEINKVIEAVKKYAD